MADLLDTLIVVFDGAGARFFKCQTNGHLRESAEMQSGLHRNNRETVSDKQGQSFASAGTARHSYEPKQDPHKKEKHDFVHSLVATLDNAFDQGAFKHLIVVAPQRSIGEFRKLTAPKLQAAVLREVPKELAHYSRPELEERLKPILAELA